MWALAIAGAAAGLAGSIMSSEASKKASKAQAQAAANALALEREQWEYAKQVQAPWITAGQWALGAPGYTYQPQYETMTTMVPGVTGTRGTGQLKRGISGEAMAARRAVDPNAPGSANPFAVQAELNRLYGPKRQPMTYQQLLAAPINPETGQPYQPGEYVPGTGLAGMIERGPGEFEESPSYQFVREEALKGMERGASAMGGLRSGRLLRGAGRYSADLASMEYDNFLRRYYASLAPYETLAGLGQTSAQSVGGLGAQYAGMGMNALLAGGQAQAAGALGQAYPYSQLANWGAGNLMNHAMYNQPQGNALTQYQMTAPGSYYGGGVQQYPIYQPPPPSYGGTYNPIY